MSRLSSTDTPTDEAEATEPDQAREALLADLTARLAGEVVESHIAAGDDLWVRVTRAAWVDAGRYLRDGLGFHYFSFLSAIDWQPSPFGRDMDAQVDTILEGADDESAANDDEIEHGVAGGETRFQVFARVNDIVNGLAVTLKVDLPDDDLSIESWTGVYAGANWHEREAWEMYGISFNDHPGLRRRGRCRRGLALLPYSLCQCPGRGLLLLLRPLASRAWMVNKLKKMYTKLFVFWPC